MSQPTFLSSTPTNNATNVVIDITVQAVFDQPLASSSISAATVTLFDKESLRPLSSQILVEANKIIIKPYNILPKNTLLGLVLRGGSNGIKNGAGEYLAANEVISFTTGVSYETPGPTVPDVPTYPDGIGSSPTAETSPEASGTSYATPLTPDEFYIISTAPGASTSNLEPSGMVIEIDFNAVPDPSSVSSMINVRVEPVNGDYSLFQPYTDSGTVQVVGNSIVYTPA
jgi:hypothetical protein